VSYLKKIGLAAIAAIAITAFTAGSASATSLEVNGVTKNQAVTISASIAAGNILVLARTDGAIGNTCTTSTVGGTTSTFTGTKVTGALSVLAFTNCNHPVTVHQKGQFYIEHEAGTTAGTVFSENAEWTSVTSWGFTVTCKTGAGTKIGTLQGVASGTQSMELNTIVNCGFLLPSAQWAGVYTITTSGLGVSA
jgi:hypothetical protein